MYNPGNLENNGANQNDDQKRNSENFVGRNMSLTSNNANSPQSESASKTSTTAALRRWRRPEAQDSSSKNVSIRSSSSDSETGVKHPPLTGNQSKEMNPINNNSNSYANNTHIDNLNSSASQNNYTIFVSPASLSPIVPQSTARPYDTNTYIPRVPPETGAYSRTSPVVTTPNKLISEVKSSDTTVRHPISGNIQSPYYPHDNAAQQHYRNTVGYPIQNTPPLTPTSTQSPIYGVPNQKRDYGYQNYTSKCPQEQRLTREHSVLTHSYSAGSGINLDSSRVQGIGDDSKMNGYRQDNRAISQGYHLQNTAERRVTPPKPKSPTYRNFSNSSAMMDSRILAQNYVTSSGRVQAAEYMAQNYYLNKSSCIVQEARVQNQIHSTENPILDSRYQQSFNSYMMPKSTVINSQDPKLYRNVITNSKAIKHAAPFPILEQRLNTADSYSPEYLAQNNPQSKYAQVILPRSSPTSRITRDSGNVPMHSNYLPQSSNQKCPQEMMIPSNYPLHNKYFQQNASQDWRLIKDYEHNTHLNQMNQMHNRIPQLPTNRTPEVPRDIPYVEQNQRIIQKPRAFYPEPGSVEYLQYAGKTNMPVTQKSPKVISYNVSDQRMPDQIQNDYLNLTRTSSNAVRPNDYSRNPVIQTPNVPEGPHIVHQAYRSDVPNDQHNFQMVPNSRHPSYAINYSNRQVKEIPPRNISPRRTFQENMPYFVISPPHAGLSNTSPPSIYNSEHPQHNYPGYYSRDPNYPGVGTKPSIPQYPIDSAKYQNMPYGRNISQHRYPYGYQEQYFQRNMEPNQFPANMYRQHNPAISDHVAQARTYPEEYRNEDSINSNYNEFERNRRKEEIGKSLKEFLESWEDDEDIVSNLPDLVLNIPADRQKNNSVSSLESGENNETGKAIPTNEIHKDDQENPQAEPLYVLDARSISSDALSQYLPYCKVYQSLPENIRGFYPNSVPSEDDSTLSQQVASKTPETQPDNEDLDPNIIDSPSPHDLSLNRETAKEDNVQAEVLNLSTNRSKENDEFMTEEYSNASDDTSVPENVSSSSINDTFNIKEEVNEQCQNKKSSGAEQDKKKEDIDNYNKQNNISKEYNTKVENKDNRESLETSTEKPITASVIVQNTFLPNKSENSSEKSKENQSEIPNLDKSLEESSIKISEINLNDSSDNISSKNKNLEKKRPSVDSMESADSIRTSLIESEIKDIDFNKDNLDDDQFDFDTALLSTETKDSNEDVSHDLKSDEDANEKPQIKDGGIDLSLETMLLSPEPMDTSFKDCIPEIASPPEIDRISVSILNNEEKEGFNKPSVENEAEEVVHSKNNQVTTDLAIVNDDSLEMPVDKHTILENTDTEVSNECEMIQEPDNFEKIFDNPIIDDKEHCDNFDIKKHDTESDFAKLETTQGMKNYNLGESTEADSKKKSENVILEQLTSEEEKVDDYTVGISKKEMDLCTMDDENPVCESQFNYKSSFAMAEILKRVENSKKKQEEKILNSDEGNIELYDSKLSETIEQTNVITPVSEEDFNKETENHANQSIENSLENPENIKDESSVENNKSDTSSITEDKFNIAEIENKEISQKSLDVELPEIRRIISFEQNENNEPTVGNDIKGNLIECTETNENITIDTNVNNELKNENLTLTTETDKDDIIENVQELSNECYANSIEMPSENIANDENLNITEIDVNHENTNEIFSNAKEIEVSVINEENISTENECNNNLIESNILINNSPPVSIQEVVPFREETTDKEITDETIKESEYNEIEIITENKLDIDTTNASEKDKISNIKHETSLFDEDTRFGFEDLHKNIDKKTELVSEVKSVEIENTIKEFVKENTLNSDFNNTLQTITEHVSSDAEEYQHLIKLEDEETLDKVDVEKDDTSINKNEENETAPTAVELDKTPDDATNIESTSLLDSKQTLINNTKPVMIQSLSNEFSNKEKQDIIVESPKNIQNELPINLQYSENISTFEEDKISKKVLEDQETDAIHLLEDDTTTKVKVLFSEEILVEDILANETVTYIENNSNEIIEKVEENIIVSDDPRCVVVYSDDENIVILQSNSNELVIPVNEESTSIPTKNTNDEEAIIKENIMTADIEKEEFIQEKIIEEEIIGNEVIICENGIDDDWIQNEEIVETKIENQVKKENEKSKVEDIEKKRLLMEKRREKKKRLEKLRKRKLFSAIKATNIFLEEERKACFMPETLIKNSNSDSPFKEKITDDKELFINPENPSSSSEDNSSMTHELLNLKPRIKRCFSSIDSSSPKIDFVAPKRRYSNMEYVRNNLKKPIISLDEISNNITRVIENLHKQESLQYNHSFDNSKPTNKIQEYSKIDHKHDFVDTESKNICSIPKAENEKQCGRFKIFKVINTDDLFAKPTENLEKTFTKPIINFINEREDKNSLSRGKIEQESDTTLLDSVVKSKNLDGANKSDGIKLNEPKNENISGKLEVIGNEEKSVDNFESIKEVTGNIKFDTTADPNYENLPSFLNYTKELKKQIKVDVVNKDDANKAIPLLTPPVVLKPLSVSKITSPVVPEIEERNLTTSLNSLILNKHRNIDPRIDRPKETAKPDISSVLIKDRASKTFGLTEYTKHYLKMKTGQTINPQIHFGQNGIKRLDPRLTTKPEKAAENVETVVLSKESAKHKNDINTKLKNNQEKKVKINLQDYRNRKLSLSESEKQSTNPKEQLDETKKIEDSLHKSDSTNGLTNTEPCRFYIRDKSQKNTNLLDNKTVENLVIKPKNTLEKISNDTFGVPKDNTNNQSVTTIHSTNNHNLDCNNLLNDNINKTLKLNLDFKTEKPKKRRKRFRNLDASDEEDEIVTKQQNVISENQNGNAEKASLTLSEDSQHSSTISKHSGSGDSNCSCCVDLNSNGGTIINNCGLKCHIKLNSLDNKIRNYEINKNTSGLSNLKLTLKPVKKKPKPAFAEVLSSIDSVVENEVKTTKRKPHKPGLNKCDSGKKTTMWTIKNKVPKVIIKRNASGYCAVFRDVSSNPIWQPKIRLKRQKYIESLVLSNQVKISKQIPS